MAEQTVELQKRYKVKNLCPWALGIGESGMNVHIPFGGVVPMKGEDIDLLIANDNSFFWGTGDGNHAKVMIMDEGLRKYFGLDNQIILSKEKIVSMLELKTDTAFEKNLKEFVVATHEKKMLGNFLSNKQELAKVNALRLRTIEDHIGQTISY